MESYASSVDGDYDSQVFHGNGWTSPKQWMVPMARKMNVKIFNLKVLVVKGVIF
jgi:hypothetical protein